jgi:hypothetical protein
VKKSTTKSTPDAVLRGSRHRPDGGREPKNPDSAKNSPERSPLNPDLKEDKTVLRATPRPSAILAVAKKLARRKNRAAIPPITSFLDFLTHHARVKSGSAYIPYHFRGREALLPIVQQLDALLASGQPDASLALCGGAQFGKTVLMLNLLAYLVAVRFRNVGYYLPDDDLVAGLVDGKLRPDVLDQIPWLARLLQVGKTLAPTGRAVNRKGAFLCTDGERSALAFMRGLGKIPTSFSMDVVMQDEKDDLPEEHARFLSGRMTASDLRLTLIIGTQRYHGAGQNLAFTEGTQHIGLLTCPSCQTKHNPETAWPGICRLRRESDPIKKSVILSEVEGPLIIPPQTPGTSTHPHHSSQAPRLTPEGNFTSPEKPAHPIPHTPGQTYYLGCPHCGTELDRHHPEWHAVAPERAAQRRWSYRLSQLLFPDLDLAQIVAAWQLAIRDPAQMNVFCTDRLALPKSSTQTLTPHDLTAARADYQLGSPNLDRRDMRDMKEEPPHSAETAPPFHVPHVPPVQNTAHYAGLDMGDQCWFVARTVDLRAPHRARLLWIEPIAAERIRTRVPELFRLLKIRALCVDAGPLRDLSRDLAFALNHLDEDATPNTDDPTRNIHFTRNGHTLPLRWQASAERWENARCLPVEFTQREGQGIRHKVARTQEGRLYPLLAAHRDETIARIIGELTGANAGTLIENPDGTATRATGPRFLLPTPTDETRSVLDLYERHLLAGARQERSNDGRTLRYLDKCENHFLLATAYAALAELIAPPHAVPDAGPRLPAFRPLGARRAPTHTRDRSIVG